MFGCILSAYGERIKYDFIVLGRKFIGQHNICSSEKDLFYLCRLNTPKLCSTETEMWNLRNTKTGHGKLKILGKKY